MYFYKNIKFLRKRKSRTQDDIAFALNMKRSTLSGYENQVSQPGIKVLVAFSDYFNIAVDTLLRVNLEELRESQLSQIEKGYDVYIKGSNLRVLATTVNNDNEENIELVSEKARAGYASGFADPEYIKVLPTFNLPFLSKQKKYRTFQISGDSMLPIPDGSYVTGEFIQNWNNIRNHHAYTIITIEDGVVFKVIENKIMNENKFTLHSLNSLYDHFDIAISEVKEVWKFINYISSEMPEANKEKEDLIKTVRSLKKEVREIQMKMQL